MKQSWALHYFWYYAPPVFALFFWLGHRWGNMIYRSWRVHREYFESTSAAEPK